LSQTALVEPPVYPDRGYRPRHYPADEAGAVSAAAAKRTVLAAVSVILVIAVCIAGPAGGAGADGRDRVDPTPPSNLRVTAATQSLVHLAWDPSEDDLGVAGYYVVWDRARATVAEPEYLVEKLKCGESASVAVTAFDAAGNRSSRVSTTVSTTPCTDTQPPSPPSGFRQVATTKGAVVLAWNASADNVGVVGYGVYRNLERIESPSEPTVTVGGLTCGSTYPYSIDAVDAAGNRSTRANAYVQTAPCSTPPPVETTPPPVETTPPPVETTAPPVETTAPPVETTAPPADTTAPCAADAYRAQYFSAASPNGTPVLSRCENSINYSWGTGGPGSGVPTDNFSARWVGTFDFPAGSTTFTATADDGIRLWVDGSLVIDAWVDQGPTNYAEARTLTAGSHEVKVEYYERGGGAVARVSWTSASSSGPPPADTTAPSPPTDLEVSSVARTSVSLEWTASTDDVGVAGYGTYVDGSQSSSEPRPTATIPSLDCGTAYAFDVDAYDAAGNRSTTESLIAATSACADTQAPTAPTNVVATSRTTTSIAISWSPATDNVGVTGYGLYRGGVQQGTSTSTTWIFAGLACNTNYTLAVEARDASGNWSSATVVMVSTTACPDATPPSAPANVSATSITQSGLTLNWSPSSDNVAVAGYDVFRNGTRTATVTSTSSSQGGLACGTSYSVGVEAFDAAGNRSARTSASVSTTECAPPPSALSGPVYYVDQGGSDTAGNGSSASPWRTLKRACDTVSGGTISVGAGTFTETGTCTLRSGTSLDGAGAASTTIRAASSAVNPLILVQNTTGPQTISDLKLDGQSRTTSDYGMRIANVARLTVTRLDVTGFRGTQDFSGGGINVLGATDFELSHSTLSNNASVGSGYCSADLGLGALTRASIHDNVITSPQGYSVKMAATYSIFQDSAIFNNRFNTLSSTCSSWNTLGVELWSDGRNSTFHHNWLNKTLSMPEVGQERPLASGFRWRIHNNHFAMSGSGVNYAIEAGLNGSVIDHNYFEGGLYPFGHFHAGHNTEQNEVHHNVFDKQHGPTAAWHEVSTTTGARFHHNTVVLRQSSWRDGVFSFGEAQSYSGSTIDIRDNIFKSTVGIGDKLGIGLGGATIDRNAFHNLTGRGSSQVNADPLLPLAGSFPGAYVPSAGSPAAGLGAFADGLWSVGPQ
jgi:chitodextrinase